MVDGDDLVTIRNYLADAKYVYTGVPWVAPQVQEVITDQGTVALDGEPITLRGIGFARSPWTKCYIWEPDYMQQNDDDAPPYTYNPSGMHGVENEYAEGRYAFDGWTVKETKTYGPDSSIEYPYTSKPVFGSNQEEWRYDVVFSDAFAPVEEGQTEVTRPVFYDQRGEGPLSPVLDVYYASGTYY